MKVDVNADRAHARRAASPALETGFRRIGRRTFVGVVSEPRHPERTFAVELLVDGRAVAAALADRDEPAFATAPGHAFRVVLDAEPTAGAIIEARIANIGTPIGSAITSSEVGAPPTPAGFVRWNGGLRFTGWVPLEGGDTRLGVHVDGQLVTEVRPSGWTMAGAGEHAHPVRTFDVHLPARFADGRLHRLAIAPGGTDSLPGGPVLFTASAGGYAAALPDGASGPLRARADLLDRLAPMSFPMARYAEWRGMFPVPPPLSLDLSIAVVTVGDGAVAETLATLETQTHSDWIAAALPGDGAACAFTSDDLRDFLDDDAAVADVVVLTLAGARLAPEALARLAAAFAQSAAARIAYSDVEIVDAGGQAWPVLFPAFDRERMAEQGYAAHFFAIRREALIAVLAEGASDLYSVFASAAAEAEADAIVHVPGALATLPAFEISVAASLLADATTRAIPAAVVFPPDEPGMIFPSVRVRRERPSGSVSVVLTIRNRPDRLDRCLDSIDAAVRAAKADLIIVDNDTSDPAALGLLDKRAAAGARVIPSGGARNRAHLANVGVEAARGDLICLIDADITAVTEDWLDELLGRMADPNVGAAGPLMLYPGGVVAHMGMVAGPAFSVAPALSDRGFGDPGYADLLRVAHEQSALGPGCLVFRRADYLAAGGMDAIRFPEHVGIVDLCLRLRAAGKRIVVTPHARMETVASSTTASAREIEALRARWAETLTDDPFYSPLLALDGVPFSALAWPPRPNETRTARAPVPRNIPPGF